MWGARARAVTMWATACAGMAIGAARLQAQSMTLLPGAKVRIDAPAAGIRGFEGTIIATGDTMDIARGDARVRVPTAAMTRLELSRGKSAGAGAVRGAMWGGGVGLGLGLVTMGVIDGACESSSGGCRESRGDERLAWLGMNTLGGAVWGVAIGALVGRERWRSISPSGLVLAPVLGPAGGMGVRVGFTRR